jgi:hypothetical protein
MGFGDVYSCFYNRFVSTGFLLYFYICLFGALTGRILSTAGVCWRLDGFDLQGFLDMYVGSYVSKDFGSFEKGIFLSKDP